MPAATAMRDMPGSYVGIHGDARFTVLGCFSNDGESNSK